MQNKLTQIALFWFGNLMAAAFLCCGFLFLLTDFYIDNLPQPRRTWLGILFLAYSGYRGWRQYSMYKKIRQNTDEE